MGKIKKSLLVQLAAIIALLVCYLLVSAFYINYLQNRVLRQKTIDANEVIMEQTGSKIQHFYQNMKNQITAFSYNPTVSRYLDGGTLERTINHEELENVFTNTILIQEDIIGIALYDSKLHKIASAGEGAGVSAKFGLVDSMTISDIQYLKERGTPYYMIFYPIYDLTSDKFDERIGMTAFMMEGSNYRAFLEDGLTTKHTQALLVDKNNTIIAARGTDEVVYEKEEDSDYYEKEKVLTPTGWKLIYRIPRAELLGETGELRFFSMVSYFVAAVVLSVLGFFCYYYVIRPIRKVDTFVKRNAKHSRERLMLDCENEIGILAQNMNRMLDEKERLTAGIQESREKMYQLKLSKKEMELLAYRNQINPHFLYNTFECIRGMALYHDAQDIAEITMNLSDVFRYAVKGSEWTTLAGELENVKKYARIIEYRFGGRIMIETKVEREEYLAVPIVKLLLQPIVENAVFHGLESKIGSGHVWLLVRMSEENMMEIQVEDDGLGMEEEKLRALQERLADPKSEESGKHIGLVNICHRLALYFGNRASVAISSRLDEGSCVIVRIPVLKEGGILEGIKDEVS